MFVEISLLIFIIIFLIYLDLKQKCRVLDESGIGYVKPHPIFGNFFKLFIRKEHISSIIENIQKQFPSDKYVGVFNFMTPVILVQDLNLIQDITVKNFNSFHDRGFKLSNDVEALFGRSLPNLRGQKWREMRMTLSPAYTSSKMKNMYGFITECAKELVKHYEDLLSKDNEAKGSVAILEVEAGNMTTRFATDVIASTAFGLTVNSHEEPDNYFFRMGQIVSYINIPKFLGYSSCPKLLKFFNVKLIPDECAHFFKKLFKDSIQQREDNKIYRPDMIHLLMEAKKGVLKDEEASNDKQIALENTAEKISWTDDDLAAQVMLFFLAGFETTSMTLSFLFFSLASHQDVQEKLYQEILETRKEHKDVIDYETIQSMKYLDMVISETLRRWPSGASFLDRYCSQDFTLPPTRDGAKEFKIKANTIIWYSPNAVHKDAKHWPEPKKFDPERFSDANKQNIPPFSFMPFGVGPRNCIGKRFSLLELKVLAFYVVDAFLILRNPKMKEEPDLDPTSFSIKTKDGVYFNLKLREKN